MPNIQPKIPFFLTGDLPLEIEMTRIKGGLANYS